MVEDNAAVRQLSVNRLESLGYKAIEAVDADAALQCLSARSDIDLVFTDIIMPGSMTGYELAQRISEDYPGTGVLLTTAYAGKLLDREGQLQNGYRTLRKPYRQKDLADALHAVFGA